MDFSTIAKRTRSRDPEYYRWLHEKLRNERDRASANVDGQASSSEARSGNSAGQSVGGGRSSTDPSNSTGHNVLDCEDEEEEQRKLKKQKPNISKKMTQGNKGRQRVEAPRTIRELERATQEAERKKDINKGSCNTKDKNVVHIDDEETDSEERTFIIDLKQEVEEAVAAQRRSKKNIITEPAHQALDDDDSDDNTAFSENQNACADVEVEEQETFVGLEDEVEVELISAKKSSKSNLVGESAHQAHGHDSEDGFAVPIKQNSSVDIEVQARESSVDLEEEVQIVAEKPSTTKRVRVKEETIYIIDLEQEVEETVASEKSIVIEATHQAPGSGSGIAFSKNQNASSVDEQRAFVSGDGVSYGQEKL